MFHFKKLKLWQGIGHRIKSVQNPDMRVTILKDYVKKTFAKTDLLDCMKRILKKKNKIFTLIYVIFMFFFFFFLDALEVEKITTAKKSNLILNIVKLFI